MLERVADFYRKRSPEIETGLGAVGLTAMGAAALDPEKMRHATDFSPVGYSAVFDAASKVGAPDEVTFIALTLFFGFATIQGVARIKERNQASK